MKKFSRRQFLILPVGLLSTAPINPVQASPLGHILSEDNPQAISLGYKLNVASIDRLHWTQFIPGQSCKNCILYQGEIASTQGSCKIFVGQIVMASGWCSLYKSKS